MGSVQSRDNVDILVHGCGAGKLIRKYSQILWTNTRESSCLKINVGTATRQAHILGFLPTWAPNHVHFNVRQKTSHGLIFTSLKEKVVVLLFDYNDRMTLEETKKYFNAWYYNLGKHADRVLLVGVSGGLEACDQRVETRNREPVTEAKLRTVMNSLRLHGLQTLKVDLDNAYQIKQVFTKAGGLFYMNFVSREPLITEPFEDEDPKPVPEPNVDAVLHVHLGNYKLNSMPTGLCLVINNINFNAASLDPRRGSEKDYSNIERVFSNLGFLVQEERDLTASQIDFLLQQTAHGYHADLSCLVIFFLSHGRGSDTIHGVDGHVVRLQDVMRVFDGENCPQMAGKPKLFFFQSCRGGVNMRGVQPAVDSGVEDNADDDGEEEEEERRYTIPAIRDTLIGFSTEANHVAYRCPENGSWYIQTLTETLERLCEDYDIEDILKITTEKVSMRSTPEGYKMCPNYRTNLAKKLRFRRSPSAAVRGKYSTALAVQGR